jgi:hypothetical protein
LAVSLDCSRAFDKIGIDSVSRALEKHKVTREIIVWYNTILHYGKVTANLQGKQMTVRPGRGSPQGGILSPLIWNLIIGLLPSAFQTGPVKVLGYADDTLVHNRGAYLYNGSVHAEGIGQGTELGGKKWTVFQPNEGNNSSLYKIPEKCQGAHSVDGQEEA